MPERETFDPEEYESEVVAHRLLTEGSDHVIGEMAMKLLEHDHDKKGLKPFTGNEDKAYSQSRVRESEEMVEGFKRELTKAFDEAKEKDGDYRILVDKYAELLKEVI